MPVNISPPNSELIIDLENKTLFLFKMHFFIEMIIRETTAVDGGTRRKYRRIQDRAIGISIGRIEVDMYGRDLIHR